MDLRPRSGRTVYPIAKRPAFTTRMRRGNPKFKRKNEIVSDPRRTGVFSLLLLFAAGCVSVNSDHTAVTRLKNRAREQPRDLDLLCLEPPEYRLERETEVPMRLLFGLPTVSAECPEREFSFLIDTGSQFCLVRPGIVEELGLPLPGRMRLSLLGKRSDSFTTCLPSLSVGEIECRRVPFVVSPGHLEKQFLGITVESVDGVLGMTFLRHFVTTLDFENGRAVFTPKTGFLRPRGEDVFTIPMSYLGDGRPCVAATLEDGNTYLFLVDTGARRCVVSSALARRLGFPDLGKVKLLSLGVQISATLTRLSSVSLGEITFSDVTAYVLPTIHGNVLERVDGLLGIDFLQAFTVSIDTEGRNLILSRKQ